MADPTAESPLKSQTLRPELPFGGEFHLAPDVRFEETILLVPFFGGRKQQLRRHVELVNQLGFHCAVFDLRFQIDPHLFSPESGFGLKHVWADQIEQVLNEVPGRKILYSFSNTSASAIEATARRRAFDIAGLICDSGPSGKLWLSMLNYYRVEEPISWLPLRWAAALKGTFLWSPRFLDVIREDLQKLPEQFRILSIRGWKDPLISPDQIDLVFEPQHHLNWSRLSLPKAGHLDGLKKFRELYVPGVTGFLTSIATPTSTRK